MIGALLITASAVGVGAAYLGLTATATTTYLVASTDVVPGTRLGSVDDVVAAFGRSELDLPATLAERAVPAEELEELVGQVVTWPMQRGDLLSRTSLVDASSAPSSHRLSFALPSRDAIGGALRPGSPVDVVATFGAGEGADTVYVVRGVSVLAVASSDGAELGGGRDLIVTVSLDSAEEVLALAHAIHSAKVVLTSSVSHAPGPTSGGDPDA